MNKGTYYGEEPQAHDTYILGLERMTEMLPEIRKLHADHWDETEVLYLDDKLDPDYEMMEYLEQNARMLCFTIRDGKGNMVGNSMFFLAHSTHIKNVLQATEDTFFISKDHRGGGLAGAFICYIERYLRGLGVVYMGMSDKSPCGGKSLQRLMQANGFKSIAVHYLKKIGEIPEEPTPESEEK